MVCPASPKANYWDIKQDFGAVGDGSTDDGTKLSQAMACLATKGTGGTLFFPPGVYSIQSGGPFTLPSGVRLLGTGWTEYNPPPSAPPALGSVLRLDGPTMSPPSVFLNFVTPSGGSLGAAGGISHMSILDPMGLCGDAVVKVSASGLVFLDNQIVGANSTGLALRLTTQPSPSDSASRCHLIGGRVFNQGGPAVRYEGNFDCITVGLRMIAGGVVFEQTPGLSGTGGVGNQCVGCRLSTNGTTGGPNALIHGPQTLWAGCLFDNPGGAIANVILAPQSSSEAVDGTSFTGCFFRNFAATGTKHAVRIDTTLGGTAKDINLTGCRTQAPSNPYADFLSILGGSEGVIVIALTGENCAKLYDTGTGAFPPAKIGHSFAVSGSTRYPSEAADLYTLTGASGTTFTIPHGLGLAPKYVNVIAANQLAISQKFYVSAVDATNITLTYSASVSGTLKWYWEAKLLP